MKQISQRRGLMLVLSSPSGAGKTTLSRRLLESDGNIQLVGVRHHPRRCGRAKCMARIIISSRPRNSTPGATDGKFLEHATVFGNRYGTPVASGE